MGMYLNPGNSGFETIRNGRYVDKSGLISLINRTIGTTQKLTCISRPRRFGKSFAAKMLCAYYDKTCDSQSLFCDLAIAVDEERNESYRKHLNQYDVIYLDMTNIMGKTAPDDMVSYIEQRVTEELLRAYPKQEAGRTLDETLLSTVEMTKNKFIMIIDEWDAPIRETPEIEKSYLHFLRMLFKGSGTTDRIFAAVYMTGILPVRKDGSQSAISDFKEFTMVNPWLFSEYVGFTEQEVKELCLEQQGDFQAMKQWYDGYTLGGMTSVYNPNSVMEALQYHNYRSYWIETSASRSLMEYISLDFDGMSRTTAQLLGGVPVPVDPYGFSNDLVTFRDRDDVLTLLIHLGYLAYDQENQTARIPNEEIRLEFARAVRGVKRHETIRRVRESDRLIYDTIHQDAEAVAAQIEKIHAEETAILFYNNEQSLRSVVKLAYFSYRDHYLKFEELPAGDGYADLVYLPRKMSSVPALVIELKWNQNAEGAIAQIREKQYPEALRGYEGEVLLVGIGYDKNAREGKRKHSCRIEKVEL
ncbi:MAG: ATP-binding protein [Lachnospiraceae bacterium]|nr:ATP-binding protein [Lachnospiraceae bacterium]